MADDPQQQQQQHHIYWDDHSVGGDTSDMNNPTSDNFLFNSPLLQDPNSPQSASTLPIDYTAAAALGLSPSTFSDHITFQVPRFLGPSVLVDAGGVDVMPGPLFPSNSASAPTGFPWFGDAEFVQDPSKYDDPTALTSAFPQSSKYYSINEAMIPSPHPSSSQPQQPFDFPPDPPPPAPPPSAHYHTQPIQSQSATPQTQIFGLQPEHSPPVAGSLPLLAPSVPRGLPVYSASGFDMLGVLARVATRNSPKIVLGPVDMTCSFVVADVRRYDTPIVYASPTFSRLTGYSEAEILGRNCRFLQAPSGQVERGSVRKYTAQDQVAHLKKCLTQDKECQASLINYRKNGNAFINLVTIIPIPWDTDEITYHVGFQVDLTEQPNAILQTMRDGSYIVNYSSTAPIPPSISRNPNRTVSRDMRVILASIFGGSAGSSGDDQDRQDLNMTLLEHSPDVVHVLSLKGSFLFVSPSVKRVLEYDDTDLMGKSISDICHPSDTIPLMRELKESSPNTTSASSSAHPSHQKMVNLLFRVQRKISGYVWVECLGRLHIEPGKGRKAIILSARTRDMPRLAWESVHRVGGVGEGEELWAQVSRDGLLLVVSPNVRDVLGAPALSVVGSNILSYIRQTDREKVKKILDETIAADDEDPRKVKCELVVRVGGTPPVPGVEPQQHESMTRSAQVCFFPPSDASSEPPSESPAASEIRKPSSSLICLVRTFPEDDLQRLSLSDSLPSFTASRSTQSPRSPTLSLPPRTGNVFEELETTRSTSWQYELQQLKISNKRMREEVEGLEAAQLAHAAAPTISAPAPPSGPPAFVPDIAAMKHRKKRTRDSMPEDSSSGPGPPAPG